jgi:hypothetical protein
MRRGRLGHPLNLGGLPAVPGGMADLTALLLLAGTGWWDGALARMGARRSVVLAAGGLALAAAWINVALPGPVPLRVNLGGALPAVVVIVAPWVAPAWGTRLSAAAAVAACFLFGLGGWSGGAADLGLPLLAAVSAVLVAGAGPMSVLAAAAAPALADLGRWVVAWADGLPGAVWIGGGPSFATAVLGATAVGLILAVRTLPRPRHLRQTRA